MNRRRLVIIALLSLVAASCASSDGDDAATAVAEKNAPAETDAPVETDVPVETDGPAEEGGYDFAAIGPIVGDFVETNDLNGAGLVIVDADDGVVHEDYWGEFSAERISLIASSSKMIAAGVLLALQDDGLIDIDAPVADVTGWDGNPEITTAQLISNSSGLVGLGPNPAYPPYLCQFFTDSELEECGAAIFQTPDDDGDIVPPDTEFRYGGAQWQVAGAVAETVSGQTWAKLIDEIYVEPCGLETLGFNNHWAQAGGFGYPAEFIADGPSMLTDTENPQIEGGAYATTGDYAKLLLMHLRGGMCGENQVLSQAALDTMHDDRIAAAYEGSAGESTGYGMGWWVDRETGRISDGGAYGSVPWLDPEDGYGAYLVIEADSGTGGELASLLENVVDDAMNAGS